MGRPRKYPERDVLIATDSGVWTSPDGEEFLFIAGQTRVRAGHPLARAIPQSFEPITVHYDVEEWHHGQETESRVVA